MMRTYWLAEAEYADGTTIERWRLKQHPDLTWMSVIVCDRY